MKHKCSGNDGFEIRISSLQSVQNYLVLRPLITPTLIDGFSKGEYSKKSFVEVSVGAVCPNISA